MSDPTGKPAMNMPELLEVPVPLGTVPLSPADEGQRSLPTQGRLPLSVLGAIGEQLAARASVLLRGVGEVRVELELERLERWGLQLQELAKVAARAPQLRREPVDLGLAVLQTVAEWSTEAARTGVELHGPACSVEVDTNPAALKHLLDLLLEHALQQGGSVRLEIDAPADSPFARVVALVDAAPATQCPVRDTMAWHLLMLLARALALAPERQAIAGGERLVLPLPRG